MSQFTLDNLIRAALTTRGEAIANNPQCSDDAWSQQFAVAFKNHLNDEANRFWSGKGCAGFLRTGDPCPGLTFIETEFSLCDNCEAQKVVRHLDNVEARLSGTSD